MEKFVHKCRAASVTSPDAAIQWLKEAKALGMTSHASSREHGHGISSPTEGLCRAKDCSSKPQRRSRPRLSSYVTLTRRRRKPAPCLRRPREPGSDTTTWGGYRKVARVLHEAQIHRAFLLKALCVHRSPWRVISAEAHARGHTPAQAVRMLSTAQTHAAKPIGNVTESTAASRKTR